MDHHSADDAAEKSSFYITLKSTGRDPLRRPTAVRLRQLLKIALRGLNLRCTSITESANEQEVVVE